MARADLSTAEAARIAIASQRLAPRKRTNDLLATVDHLGVLQLDSVNVVCRAHYLPMFSRHGGYARSTLDAAAWGGLPRPLFEYWGHEASLLPSRMQPLFRWRMDRAARGVGMWGVIARFGVERAAYVDEVLAEVRARGPVRASDIGRGETRRGTWWWSRSDAKIALEWLFWAGRVTTATRRHFERIYDVTERVLPREVLDAKTPAEPDAHRTLLAIAAKALGIATENDLRDYFRLGPKDARPRIDELVDDGTLERVSVDGWDKPAFVHRDARVPRSWPAKNATVIAPFDPLVWYRPRAERIFGFRYRIEIYTPASARKHGYYVLPVLFGDRLVARVDLKALREDRALGVLAAHVEPGSEAEEIARPLAEELGRLSSWLDLGSLRIASKGNLARALRRAAA